MPVNEVPDNIRDFFEQENLSKGLHHSQVAIDNWPVSGGNLLAGKQRRIGLPLSSNTNSHDTPQLDSDRLNDRQRLQTILGTDDAKLSQRLELVQRQFKNERSLNGHIHGHEGTVSDQLKRASRCLSIVSPRLGNDTEHRPFTATTSESLDSTNSPINFNFLGKEQQLMRGQQSSMPQPQPSQQSGYTDMQLWQQQLMYKQLQELQRQKQLQQLDQEARQQNQINQLSAIARQAAHDQLPSLVNGTPIHDASNFMWPNEVMGGDPKVPNSSQMFMAGNMTWAQRGGSPAIHGFSNGLPFSNEQGQELRSMGLVPQHDQSLYGAPVGSTRSNFNQYPHVQGISQDYSDVLTKGASNQLERQVLQSSGLNNSFHTDQSALLPQQISLQDGAQVSRQGSQGNFFGHSTFPGINSGVPLGNLQQFNPLSGNALVQEFQGRQQQTSWSGNVQEKPSQVGPSQIVSLDPTEKKILFSSDDDVWDASMGRDGMIGAGGYGNALESMDYLSGFPSIQSGTWSALMQSAVAEASSSDTGMQDEWSGLSFQKTELSTGNQPGTLSDSTKQQADWADNNLQTASSLTSRPLPLFDDAKRSLSGGNNPGFQQSSMKNSYEQGGRMQPDVSHEPIHQTSKESSKWLGSHQVQPSMHLGNASQAAWARRMYEQSANAAHSTDMESNAQNLQGSWIHRQNIASYNVENHTSNKPSGWNVNESLSPSSEPGSSLQRSQGNDINRSMHVERERDSGAWKADDNRAANALPSLTSGLEQMKSGTGHQVNREALGMSNFMAVTNSNATKTAQETSQQVLNNHQPDYGKHVVDSSIVESRVHNSDRESGETYDKKPGDGYQKVIPNDRYSSNQLHPTVTGGGLRENSWLSPSESRSLASATQKSSGQIGRKGSGSRRFQYHPMGNLEVDLEPADNSKRLTNSQASSQPVAQVTKNHEQDYFGRTKFVGHASNNAIDMEKGQLPDFQGNAKVASSLDGSTGFYAQSKRNVQTCQNMLELFHKVDQSREQRALAQYSSSDHNPQPELSETEASDASVAHQWRNQSAASQGFGLRLAPPSQRLPATNQTISSQNSSPTINGPNSRHADPLGEKSQTWLAPTSNAQALSSHETSPREQWNNRTNISGETGNESSQSSMQMNPSAAFTSTLPHSRDHARSLLPGVSGQVMPNHSTISSRQTYDTHNGVLADQSTQGSLPGTASRMTPFNLATSVATSKPLNNNPSYTRVPGEQLPILESVPVSQSSMTSKSQHGAFSTMLQNVWTNVSAQQHLAGGLPQKVPPNLFQPFNPSNSHLERTLADTQKLDYQDSKKGGHGPEFSTCSINSQRVAFGEEQPGKESSWQQMSAEKAQSNTPTGQMQESLAKHHQDANSSASGSLMAHPHQELDRGRFGKDPALVSQTEHVSHRSSSSAAISKDIEAFGRSLKQHLLHPNYSLLHQVQAMKAMESDPNMRSGKRLKGDDSASDTQQLAPKPGPQLFDGYNNVVRDVDGELNAAVRRNSGDGKMLSFSSEGREDQSTNASSQLVPGDSPSSDVVAFGRNESHDRSSHLSVTSVRSENAQISPQMAPSWFEQYGNFKNGQIMPIYDAQRTVKPAMQQLIYGKMSENVHAHLASQQQVNAVGASQGGIYLSRVTMLGPNECMSPPHSLPFEVADQNLALMRPKKRKTETSELLPWHKEITNGSERLQNISMAEQDWAQAANRLVEKVEDEAEMGEEGHPTIRPRRRLILTTQLMQQLLRPAPASILSADANSNYETVTYYIAKLALGQACGLVSSSRSESSSFAVNENTSSGAFKNSDNVSDQYFSKVVEDFIGRGRKLEADLVRLDRRASILDIRVECQDLERFSVINRFAKFHGRPQADVAETSSSSDGAVTTQKICSQRYVTALAMPRNLPEGVQCLSL